MWGCARVILTTILAIVVIPNAVTAQVEPLFQAIADDDREEVLELLGRGTPAGGMLDENFTPLIMAATWGHDEIVGILLEHGAEVGERNLAGIFHRRNTQPHGPATATQGRDAFDDRPQLPALTGASHHVSTDLRGLRTPGGR